MPADYINRIDELKANFKGDLSNLRDSLAKKKLQESAIEAEYLDLQKKYLGHNSKLNEILKGLKEIKDETEKKKVGQQANELREYITTSISEEKNAAVRSILSKKLEVEYVDPTIPGKKPTTQGYKHIISQTIEQIEDIFLKMGFEIEYSYDIDSAYNAFDAVNIPAEHPARDSWDTLWLSDGNLAIPHTSAMQNRILKNTEIPVRKAIIGKCFRNEATDATHEHTFYQLEGVYVDKNISMADMIGVLLEFLERFFESKINYKFTPDFFPFVEPGGQMAIEKSAIKRLNSSANDQSGETIKSQYLEVLGCGMIHPNVLKMAGVDPETYSGFAWGTGIERLILLKYGIDDIRHFKSGDLRFIEQLS
jgi:phenylalanyl-tRNA synthetase alpha chain